MNDFYFPHTYAKFCYWVTFLCDKNSFIFVVSEKRWMNQQRKNQNQFSRYSKRYPRQMNLHQSILHYC